MSERTPSTVAGLPRRVCVYMACSVDGYVARPDGDISWLFQGTPDQDYGMEAWIGAVDALVMGRATYEVVQTFPSWPYVGIDVFVASSSLAAVRPEATLVRGEPAAILQQVGAGTIWIDGPETARRFLAAGLVDQITVTRIPILLGRGISFFSELPADTTLSLRSMTSYADGVTQAVYGVRAPAPTELHAG